MKQEITMMIGTKKVPYVKSKILNECYKVVGFTSTGVYLNSKNWWIDWSLLDEEYTLVDSK